MNEIARRALSCVAGPLLVQAVLLQILARTFELSPSPAFLGCALLVAALAAGLAFVRLAPVRADFAVVRRLVGGDSPFTRQPLPPACAQETAGLLAALESARANFVALGAELAQARAEIEAAEQLRVRFVAAMGHDLRGPLNAIIGFSDMLVMEGLDAVSREQRPSVEIIRRSAADLVVLLEEILEWAKAEAGQITLEREDASLQEIVSEVAHEARQRSADRGLVVQCSVASELPDLVVDRARLIQALLGLLDHATRAPDRPRVALSAWLAKDERGRESVKIELRDPQLVVRQADHQSFFEAFRPSYAPSGKRVAGLGLGPALARTLIRAHGGEVWFASQPDTGTTFMVDLPLGREMPVER